MKPKETAGGCKRLPNAELDVMLALWRAGEPMKTAKLLEALGGTKSWTMSTLQALLARLEERGFVRAERRMRFKYYSPLVREEDYRSRETETFLERLYGNSAKNLVAALIDSRSLCPEDLEELSDLLKKAGEKP